MAKSSASFVCQSCGNVTSKWAGKCDACGGWNTITEEGAPIPLGNNAGPRKRGRKFTLEDLKTMHARLQDEGVKQFRIVTHGNAWSIYFPDPEGNRCELFVDTPWHTPQPYAEPFDLEAPVATIMATTEALCRNRPGFTSRAAWRATQVERMGAQS